jgi:Glyoxalase/Bleomycin resistance protein/Dioxygenase superfamily
MSKVFGDIRQMAFIVEDIDDAIKFWAATLGIGPFFIKREITFAQYRYRGSDADSPTVSIALANSGFIQIELIQQHDDKPSIYKEHQDSGQRSLQHVSSWLTSVELKRKKADLVRQGYEIAQECVIPSSGVQLVYFSTENGPSGFIFEIADLKEPEQYERVMGVRSAHENWDGGNAIHEVTA